MRWLVNYIRTEISLLICPICPMPYDILVARVETSAQAFGFAPFVFVARETKIPRFARDDNVNIEKECFQARLTGCAFSIYG